MPEEESAPLIDRYEITFIVDEETSSEKVEKILSSLGATLEKTSDVGKKQFTHPLGKKTSGHYFAIEFTAQREKLPQIESDLKADKTLIRYLIIKTLRRPLEMPKREGTEATRKRTEKVIITKDQQDMAPESKKPAQSKEVKVDEEDKKEPEVKETPDVKAPEVPSKKDEIKPEKKTKEIPTSEAVGIPTDSSDRSVGESVGKKPTAVKKAAPAKKIEKAEKLSAAELDKKIEELVKE